MSRVRCESIEDLASGKYYLELYFPVEAERPFLTSIPLYESHEAAESAAVAMFLQNLPPEAIAVEYGPFPELFAVPSLELEQTITSVGQAVRQVGAARGGGRPSLLQRFFSQL
ncbi:MAG: hypothetical protein ABIU95_12940 [Burkholderiales bacterium]